MNGEHKPFEWLEGFLLQTPLYARLKLEPDLKNLYRLYGSPEGSPSKSGKIKFDGYCMFCQKETTFEFSPQQVPLGTPWDNLSKRYSFDSCSLACSRKEFHHYRYEFRIKDLEVQKIGQFPSLADIAIGENKSKYRSILKGENWSELYKAVGLAAHGEGIGSFVYLRRVFERLIDTRFDEHKASENWDNAAFKRMRMEEKIDHLKKYLPLSLVDNKKLYSIFSIGIHEMKNEQCLRFFEVGWQSIQYILEDDLIHKQELERRDRLSKAVTDFLPNTEGSS